MSYNDPSGGGGNGQFSTFSGHPQGGTSGLSDISGKGLGGVSHGSAGNWSTTLEVICGGGGGAFGGGGGGINFSTNTGTGYGGGGGALAYANNISVTPGNTYTVQVGCGANGDASTVGGAVLQKQIFPGGGGGGVRIVWGTNRSFPSSNVSTTTNEVYN
jgi:hypothetical protein